MVRYEHLLWVNVVLQMNLQLTQILKPWQPMLKNQSAQVHLALALRVHRSIAVNPVNSFPAHMPSKTNFLLSATQSNEPVAVFFNLHPSTSDSLRTNGLGCANFLDAHPMSLSASTSIRQMKSQTSGETFSRFLTPPTMTT